MTGAKPLRLVSAAVIPDREITRDVISPLVMAAMYGASHTLAPRPKFKGLFDSFAEKRIIVECEHAIQGADNESWIPCLLPDLNEFIQQLEGKDENWEDEWPTDDEILVCVGDRAFCQAAIHLSSTLPRGQAESWGLHFLRLLSNVEPGHVLCANLQKELPPSFYLGNLRELYSKGCDEVGEWKS